MRPSCCYGTWAVIESGTVKEIFTNPQHVTTKKFVNSAFAAKIPAEVQKNYKEPEKS